MLVLGASGKPGEAHTRMMATGGGRESETWEGGSPWVMATTLRAAKGGQTTCDVFLTHD